MESSTHEMRPITDSDVLLDHEGRIALLEAKASHTSQRFTDSSAALLSINGHLSNQDVQLAILISKMESLWSLKKVVAAAIATTITGSALIWVANNIQHFRLP